MEETLNGFSHSDSCMRATCMHGEDARLKKRRVRICTGKVCPLIAPVAGQNTFSHTALSGHRPAAREGTTQDVAASTVEAGAVCSIGRPSELREAY